MDKNFGLAFLLGMFVLIGIPSIAYFGGGQSERDVKRWEQQNEFKQLQETIDNITK